MKKKAIYISLIVCMSFILLIIILLPKFHIDISYIYGEKDSPKETIVSVETVTPDSEEIRVACVGDSITEGTNDITYVNSLTKLLDDKYVVKNFGEGGTTATNGDRSYTVEKKKGYKNSLAFCPDIVIMMFGTNDSSSNSWTNQETFKNDYKELINSYLALESNPRVMLCTPATAYSSSYGINPSVYPTIIGAINELGDELGLEVIDVNSATANHSEWFISDGIHPAQAGADGIANIIYEAVVK